MSEKIVITVSRLPESVIDECSKDFNELIEELDIDTDIVTTVQLVMVGYEAAWDASEKAQTERDKAIEGLKWYAFKPRYSSTPRNPEVYPYQQTPEVYDDGGERATSILKELGVDPNE